jgi:glycosyltransferase involved in cell wall biosynthesis
MGVSAASGDIVALLDDGDERNVPGDEWLCALKWSRTGDADRPTASAPSVSDGRRDVEGSDPDTGVVQLVPHTTAPAMHSVRHPYLSVIVPVHRGADALRHALEALSWSDLPRSEWELIVVDDASADETTLVAAEYADVVVRLAGAPRGPAYARNRGFEFARGEYVAFIDADVCVHRDTLARFVLVLSREPDVSAVFGSFDARPPARGIVSRYKNLLASYYHQQHPGPADTFWASCGAIRRGAFRDAGMFDEWRFSRRQVEDFELGYQLRERGHRIVLRPEIQATHLKQWTLGAMITADLQDRTVPWMRIVDRRAAALRRRKARLRTVKKVNTALGWLAAAMALGAAISGRVWPLAVAGACVAWVLINDRDQYRFFAREEGGWFAVAVVPLQMLSYLVNGMAVTLGWLMRELLGEPTPPPTVEAFAEVGVTMWPPVPARREHAGGRT